MPVPIVYRKSTEGIIQNFNFIDYVSGRGIVVFYPGNAGNAAGVVSSYALTTTKFYTNGDDITLPYVNATNYPNSLIRRPFDTLLNRPMIISGDAIVNIPIRAVANITFSPGASIRIVDSAGTETELASGAINIQMQSGTGLKTTVASIKIKMPRTKLKTGDTLRLVMLSDPNLTTNQIDYFFDPQGRTTIDGNSYSALDTTQASMLLPIVIDL